MGLFRKILIANRGEIAVRVIRAAREMGIRTVAVYSDADEQSLHVRLADEAVHIGPAPATKSYLNVAAILEAARQSGAEAVHPGYGFLAENAAFARAVEAAGLVFIGPSPDCIELMGNKARARQTASAAGVPVIPGSRGPVQHVDEALDAADWVGYPVMIKAAAGGGGRGIRVAENPEQLKLLLPVAQQEAQAAFGDGAVYLERLILYARHVEVQVLGDGNRVVHLYERDCSLQRRRQKLVEEALSPALDPALRGEMAAAAVRLAEAVGYSGAGTVEFLLDPSERRFYFIEMNTRIQVEHPVTEVLTGIDLVQEQIRIAAGRRLGFHQDQIHPKGWAMEFRINAEDPANHFLPSPGVVRSLEVPGGPWVRLDSAMYPGCPVPPFYDSLLAKLVVWGASREEAIQRARRALGELRIEGVKTTKEMLARLLEEERFLAGDYHTGYLESWLSKTGVEVAHA